MAHNSRTPPLPDDSLLDRTDYLEMQQVASNDIRYGILDSLLNDGTMSATEIAEELELAANKLHYHLDKLVGVGLVQNRKSKTRGESGFSSYYQITAIAEILLNHGLRELIRGEHMTHEFYTKGPVSVLTGQSSWENQDEAQASIRTESESTSDTSRGKQERQPIIRGRAQAAEATLNTVVALETGQDERNHELLDYDEG